MDDKPGTAEGYPPECLERVQSTCLHLASVLGDFLEDLVLVGGLVPTLLCRGRRDPDREAHVGTMDVDLGLSLALLEQRRYQEVGHRLRRAGFRPESGADGQVIRQRWAWSEGPAVSVDFLIPPRDAHARGGTIQHLEGDFAAIIAPGLPLAFRDRIRVRLEGRTLLGEQVTRHVWVCGPGSFLVLKAPAFRGRGESKDAYDLFHVLRHFEQELPQVVQFLRESEGAGPVSQAMEILREDFAAADSLGPRRVAAFHGRPTDLALLADATGLVRKLVGLWDEA